jgi:hypothetical protein
VAIDLIVDHLNKKVLNSRLIIERPSTPIVEFELIKSHEKGISSINESKNLQILSTKDNNLTGILKQIQMPQTNNFKKLSKKAYH